MEQPSGVQKVKVASARQNQLAKDSSDISTLHEYSVWLTKTWYSLKHEGYSNKKAWLFIDSATRVMFKGVVPRWYEKFKQESDSLMKEKNRYKRVRIV